MNALLWQTWRRYVSLSCFHCSQGVGMLQWCNKPEPGGWNRFSIEVDDLAATVEALRKVGATFATRL